MTRMSLAERRQKLIEAALAVIARDGVAAATTRAIAAQAQMPLASFHYAFESHQALMVEATRVVMGQSVDRADALELDGNTEQELVGQALVHHLSQVQAEPEQYLSLMELTEHAFRTPGQEQVPAQWRRSRTEHLERKLAVVADEQGIELSASPEQLADAVVTMADGLTQSYLATRDPGPAQRAIDCWVRAAS